MRNQPNQTPTPMNPFPNPNNLFRLGEILHFVEYCNEFYNENDGLYPIASKEEIREAVTQYVMSTEEELYFDSFDRERVRMILQPEYQSIRIPGLSKPILL